MASSKKIIPPGPFGVSSGERLPKIVYPNLLTNAKGWGIPLVFGNNLA
jgi:hypothetical protein